MLNIFLFVYYIVYVRVLYHIRQAIRLRIRVVYYIYAFENNDGNYYCSVKSTILIEV